MYPTLIPSSWYKKAGEEFWWEYVVNIQIYNNYDVPGIYTVRKRALEDYIDKAHR